MVIDRIQPGSLHDRLGYRDGEPDRGGDRSASPLVAQMIDG